ncbi:hypothetical protein OROGR_001606 [Orobanche gracilis]
MHSTLLHHGTTVLALLYDGGALLAVDTRTTIEEGEDQDPVNLLEGYDEENFDVGTIVDEEKTIEIGDMVIAHIGNTGWWKKSLRDDPNL